MDPFFSTEETKSKSTIKGKRYTCVSCGLYRYAKSPKMNIQGEGEKEILIVGSSPTFSEDRQGELWSDKTGRYLKRALSELGIDLQKDCWTVPAVRCVTSSSSVFTAANIQQTLSCRKTVIRIIAKKRPKIVIILGLTALNAIVGYSTNKGYDSLDKWRGAEIPDQTLKTWLYPMHHPMEVISSKSVGIDAVWKKDLANALQRFQTAQNAFTAGILRRYSFPAHPGDTSDVTLIDTDSEITSLLKKLRTVKEFAWDIETTGLKPQDTANHKIVCISFSYKEGKAHCFPLEKLSSKNLRIMRKLFTDEKVGKIAQNMKFEHAWFYNIYKIEVKGWVFDTMQASHILNNMPGVTGLKFQTYLNFGVFGYEEGMGKYLKSDHPNEPNKIVQGMEDVFVKKNIMLYCGLDSLYTFKLANIQRKKLGYLEKEAYQLFHKGTLALFNAEQQGMRVSVSYLKRQQKRLTRQIEKKSKLLLKSAFIRQWKHIYGNKFNMDSGTQLAHMLYTVKKLKPVKSTTSGKGSTDDETLKLLNMPEMDELLSIRKLKKAKGTYIEGFLREQVDGVIHPFFNLHIAKTFRSSSDAPNFQNIPKRDKKIKKLVRDAVYPREGNVLIEADFSKLEVSIAACYHKDPVMLKYLTSSKNDMHGDVAAQIFKIKDFDKRKEHHSHLRAAAKNGFVFPQFYGDYYVGNAASLSTWMELPHTKWKKGTGCNFGEEKLADHLIREGIRSYSEFTEHLKKIEDDFWNVRFKVYKQWKDKWMDEYAYHGYTSSATSFSFRGVMSRNEVINYPVQGAAFHCLLWSFIELDRISKEENWNTRLIGQIHDALVLDADPKELPHVMETIKRVTTVDLSNAWDWIIVPLQIEAEVSEIDGSWATMKPYAF